MNLDIASLDADTRHLGDLASLAITIATVADWLPALAALLSIVWTVIRIFETRTLRAWLGRGEPSDGP